MGVCVPNFRTVSLLVWPGDVTHTNKYINTYTHTYTSEFKNILGGCSPHVDFDILRWTKISNSKIDFYSIGKFLKWRGKGMLQLK